MYRLKIDWTYSTVSNANTALANINSALTDAGYSEQATRSSTNVTVTIQNIPTQSAAESLQAALLPAWSSATRSYGKASVVRTN